MKKFKILITIVLLTALFSCQKYLDVVPDSIGTIENAFTQRSTAEKFLFTCYSYMPKHGDMDDNPAFNAGDEIWYMDPILDVDADFHNIARGYQSTGNPLGNFWSGKNQGIKLFTALRDCNIFLSNIDKVKDMSEAERERWKAEVVFLKAYYHFYLVRMYGPIPLIKDNLPINSSPDEVQIARAPVDSCFNYIVQLLDEASANDNLPAKISVEVSELGRITRAIAKALKAKVLVTAASPLFNGNPDFASIKGDEENVPLINPVADPKKWERAAQACKEAIDFCHENFYALNHFNQAIYGNGTWVINDTIKTQLDIRTAVTDNIANTEVIWANTSSRATDLQRWTMPILGAGATSTSGPKGILAPPLKMAELFYTNNGVPIEEDKTWDYAGRFQLKTAGAKDSFYIKKNEQTVKLHFDREPRFYADLGFDRGIWFGNWTGNTTVKNNTTGLLYVQARKTEFASKQGISNFSSTGYWVKKLIHLNTIAASDGNVTGSNQNAYPWPEFRLADLYLLYAEALNEVNGPGAESYRWIDEVRARAGLAGVAYSWSNFSNQGAKHTSKEGFRQIIHQERLIELAFEGQRFWDLRRWKESHVVLNAPIKGWSIEQKDADAYYKQVVLYNQTFKIRDYFWPIEQDELLKNKKLVQNPGW